MLRKELINSFNHRKNGRLLNREVNLLETGLNLCIHSVVHDPLTTSSNEGTFL